MKVWIVIVIPYMGVRYTDSMWAREDAATERLRELRTAWTHAGNVPNTGHTGTIQEAKIADATMAETPNQESTDFVAGMLSKEDRNG